MASLDLQDRKLEEYEMQLFNFHSRSVYATCKAPQFWVSLECFSDFMAFLLCTTIYSNRWTGALWYHVDLLMTRVTLVHCLEYFHQPYGRSWSQRRLRFTSFLISSHLFCSLFFSFFLLHFSHRYQQIKFDFESIYVSDFYYISFFYFYVYFYHLNAWIKLKNIYK